MSREKPTSADFLAQRRAQGFGERLSDEKCAELASVLRNVRPVRGDDEQGEVA